MRKRRRCDRCETPLPGRKGHGMVTPAGVVCGSKDECEKTRLKRRHPVSRYNKLGVSHLPDVANSSKGDE